MRFLSSRSLLCSAAFLLSGAVCAGNDADAPAPTVSVTRPATDVEAAPKRYVGAVEAIQHVNLMPRVTGTLLKMHFKEGEMVKAGDLLYELEDTTYRAQADALKAQKEQLLAALKYADTEFKRSTQLLHSKAVAESSHDKAEMDILQAKARIKELTAALTDAENTLSYTRITAPITGRIGISVFTPGDLITPNGGKLNDIEMIAPIYVRFSLSERVFRREFGGNEGIRDRAVIRILLADNTLYNETAKVTLIDNKINSATNTITLRATFENRDRKLIPGGFVTVLASVRQEKKNVAVIPSCLIAEDSGYCVYVLDHDDRIVRREVKTGGMAGRLQIILSGLDGSERIVADGMHKVKPGWKVTPVPYLDVTETTGK